MRNRFADWKPLLIVPSVLAVLLIAGLALKRVATNSGGPFPSPSELRNAVPIPTHGMLVRDVMATNDSNDIALWEKAMPPKQIGGGELSRDQSTGDTFARERLLQSGRIIPVPGPTRIEILSTGNDGFSRVRLVEGVDSGKEGYVLTVSILDENGKPAPGAEMYHALSNHL